jgi:hypothetical protein
MNKRHWRIRAYVKNDDVWYKIEYRHWLWGWEMYEPVGWASLELAIKRLEEIKNG